MKFCKGEIMNNRNNAGGGLGISGTLGVIFIVLKLVGVIDWSWWWVLSPFWIGALLTFLIIFGAYFYYRWKESHWK